MYEPCPSRALVFRVSYLSVCTYLRIYLYVCMGGIVPHKVRQILNADGWRERERRASASEYIAMGGDNRLWLLCFGIQEIG